jgi:ATP-dependent Clp protease protease subunit
MDELYVTTTGDTTNIRYEDTDSVGRDSDNQRKYFREFDYGIDFTNNVILIQDEIVHGLTFDIISKVRLIRKINPNADTINVMLNSPGGDVVETLALIDYIHTMKSQGITFNIICRGMAMSAAALLLASGTGVRSASKHSKIMVHQLSTFAIGKLSDVKSNAKFSEQLEDECNELMSQFTKKDKTYWEENQKSDYFLNAQQALDLGIIDQII